MFRLRGQHRRRATRKPSALLTPRSSHRLGFEAMEGRLLLAASALDLSPVELEAAPIFSIQRDNYTASGDGIVSLPKSDEGGNVSVVLAFGGQHDSSQLFNSLITAPYVNLSGNLGTSINVIPRVVLSNDSADAMTSGFGTPLTNDVDGVVANGGNFSEFHATDSEGIKAVDFLHTRSEDHTSSSLGAAFDSRSDRDNGSLASKSEGGPISISVILAKEEWKLAPPSAPRYTVESFAAQFSSGEEQLPPLNATAATAPSESVISSEWARAMVLETAGGEPDRAWKSPGGKSDRLHPKSDIPASPHAGEPLSMVEPHHPAGHMIAQQTSAGAAGTDETLPITMVNWQHGGTSSPSLAMHDDVSMHGGPASHPAGSSRAVSLTARLFGSDYLGGAPGIVEAAATLPGAALEAAFGEIGRSRKAESHSLAADWFGRSLAAAPLLMVLALERVAASNSRRNRRDVAPVTFRRPKLARPIANAERV